MVDLVVQLLSGNLCLQALEDGKLELSTAFLVVQELIAHWPQSYHLHQQHQSTSRVSACGRKGGYRLRRIVVSNQIMMGLRCRVKHLMVKLMGIPISKLVWNCSKSSFKTNVKPSSGQLCPVVTKGFSCVARCAIFCIVCFEGLCRGVVCQLNGIGMHCDLLTLL